MTLMRINGHSLDCLVLMDVTTGRLTKALEGFAFLYAEDGHIGSKWIIGLTRREKRALSGTFPTQVSDANGRVSGTFTIVEDNLGLMTYERHV